MTNDPLFERIVGSEKGTPAADDVLTACAPNIFLARVKLPVADAVKLCRDVVHAVRLEIRAISDGVRSKLDQRFAEATRGTWHDGWDEQVNGYFDIRCLALEESVGKPTDTYPIDYNHLGRLMGAHKLVRHVPPSAPDHDRRPQCSILGTHAQMGPTSYSLANHAGWWDGARPRFRIRGSRVGRLERLCALSLVKRFAWALYWSDRLGIDDPREKRVPDLATIAARDWLESANLMRFVEPSESGHQKYVWSGQWLHITSPQPVDTDDDDECPDEVWTAIQAAKGGLGLPPTYCAILQMDGDGMGAAVRAAAQGGADSHRDFSEQLSKFARSEATRIVKEHKGFLVYAGGDDVLAILPAKRAIPCALELHEAFGNCVRLKGTVPEGKVGKSALTISAGIAIAHCKMDLRFVMREAHGAEQDAKHSTTGIKNRCGVRILKRSGEHNKAVVAWSELRTIRNLIEEFEKNGCSDRWVYQLAAEADALSLLDAAAIGSEAMRLMKRSDRSTEEFRDHAGQLWRSVSGSGNWNLPQSANPSAVLRSAIHDYCFLVGAASFLTRARSEK